MYLVHLMQSALTEAPLYYSIVIFVRLGKHVVSNSEVLCPNLASIYKLQFHYSAYVSKQFEIHIQDCILHCTSVSVWGRGSGGLAYRIFLFIFGLTCCSRV